MAVECLVTGQPVPWRDKDGFHMARIGQRVTVPDAIYARYQKDLRKVESATAPAPGAATTSNRPAKTEYVCDCGREFTNAGGLASHRRYCKAPKPDQGAQTEGQAAAPAAPAPQEEGKTEDGQANDKET